MKEDIAIERNSSTPNVTTNFDGNNDVIPDIVNNNNDDNMISADEVLREVVSRKCMLQSIENYDFSSSIKVLFIYELSRVFT